MYSPASALFMLRTAQNLPHILHVSLWSSSGRRLSRIALAVSGSRAQAYCASQSSFWRASAILSSISLAPGIPLAMSAAWAAILEAMMPCLHRRHLVVPDARQVLRSKGKQHRSCSNCASNGSSNMVISRSNICDEWSKCVEWSAHTDALLNFHIGCDLVKRYMSQVLRPWPAHYVPMHVLSVRRGVQALQSGIRLWHRPDIPGGMHHQGRW